jgi:hypothetical protein
MSNKQYTPKNDLPEEERPLDVDAADVPQWHIAELAKRRAEMTAHPEEGIPWRKAPRNLTADS